MVLEMRIHMQALVHALHARQSLRSNIFALTLILHVLYYPSIMIGSTTKPSMPCAGMGLPKDPICHAAQWVPSPDLTSLQTTFRVKLHDEMCAKEESGKRLACMHSGKDSLARYATCAAPTASLGPLRSSP
jgi:hypothetical protein